MILSNQYRIAKPRVIALGREYSWVSASRRIAINEKYFDEAMYTLKMRGLPFHDLFGGRDVTRVVLPYENKVRDKIEEELKKEGYSSVDWQTGEAVKVFPVSPKAPAGTQPKERREGLGKAIGRLSNGSEWLDWWANNQEHAKNDGYSIIISRHPVDVLRMSDHVDIESCHSPGAGEWESCINEMTHGGIVAYLVKSEDLKSLTPEQITGKEEIFHDYDRDIEGIFPVSRLRVRRYTHKTTPTDKRKFDLAIPELDIYGKQNWAFRDVVKDWAWKSQESLTRGERLRMRDFARRGGRYADNEDGTLFNTFFGDNLDFGDTKYGVLDQEPGSDDEIIEQRRAGMEETHEDWQRRFAHSRTEYEEEEGTEGMIYTWSGEIEVEMYSDIIAKDQIRRIEESLIKGSDSLNEYLFENGFGVSNEPFLIGKEDILLYWGSPTSFVLSITDNAGPRGGPTGYNQYCNYIHRRFDSKYDELRKVIVSWLVERGFGHQTPVRGFESSGVQFRHFNVDVHGGNMKAIAEAPIGKYDKRLWSGYEFTMTLNDEVRRIVTEELTKIIRAKQQAKGVQSDEPIMMGNYYNLRDFKFNLRANQHSDPDAVLKITFEADDLTSKADFNDKIELITVVDNTFPRIVAECMVVLEKLYDQRRAHLKELEDAGYYDENP